MGYVWLIRGTGCHLGYVWLVRGTGAHLGYMGCTGVHGALRGVAGPLGGLGGGSEASVGVVPSPGVPTRMFLHLLVAQPSPPSSGRVLRRAVQFGPTPTSQPSGLRHRRSGTGIPVSCRAARLPSAGPPGLCPLPAPGPDLTLLGPPPGDRENHSGAQRDLGGEAAEDGSHPDGEVGSAGGASAAGGLGPARPARLVTPTSCVLWP